MRIKLINLNTWFGGRNTFDSVIQYLSAEQPDIILLQEAYNGRDQKSAPYKRTVSSIQKLLNYQYAEFEESCILCTEYESEPFGNAIVSRFPIQDKKVLWIYGNGSILFDNTGKKSASEIPRNLLHCQILIGQVPYNIITLQGVWVIDGVETKQQKQMGNKILDYITDMENVILGGDFNLNQYAKTIRSFGNHMVNVFEGERVSSFNMKYKNNPVYAASVVDFIFTSPGIKVLDHYTSNLNVSDHQSQVVVLDL